MLENDAFTRALALRVCVAAGAVRSALVEGSGARKLVDDHRARVHEAANSGPGCGLEEIARSVHVDLPPFAGASVVSPRAVEDDIAAGDGLVEPPLVAHVGDRELDRETGERRAAG